MYVTEVNFLPVNFCLHHLSAYCKLRKQDVAFELPTPVSGRRWIDPISFP
jgi:hypothetical protein